MKSPSSLIVIFLALLVGLGVTFRSVHVVKRGHVTPLRSAMADPPPHDAHIVRREVVPSVDLKNAPTIFATLPVKASSGQYAERIHSLGKNVPEQEQRALVAWICSPKPMHISDRKWHYLVNEVMDSLCQQSRPLSSLTDILIGIVYDKSKGIVVRDYAIQHFVNWIQPSYPNYSCETNPGKRKDIISTMVDAAGQSKESFSGTALEGLHLILLKRQQQNQEYDLLPLPFSVEELHEVGVALATGDEVTDLARITALQVCAQRGFSEILPCARTIASNAAKPSSLRLSAIAAIGQLGTSEDLSLLENIQSEHNRQLEGAVNTALNALQVGLPSRAKPITK